MEGNNSEGGPDVVSLEERKGEMKAFKSFVEAGMLVRKIKR